MYCSAVHGQQREPPRMRRSQGRRLFGMIPLQRICAAVPPGLTATLTMETRDSPLRILSAIISLPRRPRRAHRRLQRGAVSRLQQSSRPSCCSTQQHPPPLSPETSHSP
ncbi:hypothetical protein AAFF_G00272910 [Aldrovandia affinis]|uniref:Uncharacterized protein n=1 Tax=Aldrovandia affinis TaxID=143900 RepID=A0AAD7SRD6_9TELE|nr:hypothetical protein AAFF_G00272910 [Aldrovandia affinis]